MSLSVQENRFVAVNRVGENTLQTVLQGKVEAPGAAAPIERIVWMKGTPCVQGASCDQDRVYVQGFIDLSMVYAPETLEDEPAGLRRLEWPGVLPFDVQVEVAGAEPEMLATARARILVCEWDFQPGSYSIDVDVIAAVEVFVDQEQQYSAISDVNIAKPIKLSTDGVVLNPVPPAVKLRLERELTGMLELPEQESLAHSILNIDAKTRIVQTEAGLGKVTGKGLVTLEVLLETADLAVRSLCFEDCLTLEFTLENPAVIAGMTVKEQLVTNGAAYVVNEGRNLRVEVTVEGELLARQRRPLQVLTEIGAPGNQVQVRRELLALDSFVGEKKQQGSARGLIELRSGLPPIRELLQSSACAHVTDYELDQDRLVVEGVLDAELFYLAHSEEDRKPLYWGVFPEALPFELTMALPGLAPGMQVRLELSVLETAADLINRETVEITITVLCSACVVEYLEIEAAVEAVEVGEAPVDPPMLTFVFAQSGDSIWKLSRRYHTSEEAIREANPGLDHAELRPGDRLLIPR